MTARNQTFDTSRSDALVRDFNRRNFVARRRVIRYARTVPAAPEAVFRQLCPTRECDWIDGWDCELIYTDSGYGEDRCIFRTHDHNATGPGLWTFSHVDAPRLLKIVRLMPPLLQHLTIELDDLGDGATETTWTAVVTALDEQGNELLASLPADDEDFAGSAEALAHVFESGRMKERSVAETGEVHGSRHGKGPVHGLLAAAARRLHR